MLILFLSLGRQSNILLNDESDLARSGRSGSTGGTDMSSRPVPVNQKTSYSSPCSHRQHHCHCHSKSQDCVHHQKFVEHEIIPPKEILF